MIEQSPRPKEPPSCLDQFGRYEKRSLEALKGENTRLKDLVVRLSETVVRLVMEKN